MVLDFHARAQLLSPFNLIEYWRRNEASLFHITIKFHQRTFS
jgi:hypothetical protein